MSRQQRRQKQRKPKANPFPANSGVAKMVWDQSPPKVKAAAIAVVVGFLAIVLGGILWTWVSLL